MGIATRSLGSRAWRRLRGIPTLRVGRRLVFDVTELERWLQAHREQPLKEDAR